jgi:hypothetical protein
MVKLMNETGLHAASHIGKKLMLLSHPERIVARDKR